MAHTPGPWAVRNHEIISTTERPEWADEDYPDERTCIVSLLGAMGGEDTVADARLMAAAPKMLRALEAVEARIHGVYDHPALMEYGPLHTDSDKDVLRIAEEAIKKATEG